MDVRDAVFNVLAGLAYVDGRFDPREAQALTGTLVALFGEEAPKALQRHINSIDPNTFDFQKYIDEATEKINQELTHEAKKELVKTLVLLSGVDLQVHLSEMAYVSEIAQKLGVDLESLAREGLKS